MFICSSTFIGEEKILTAGNMFHNTLLVDKLFVNIAVEVVADLQCRHLYRRRLAPRLLRRRWHPHVVSGTDLLSLSATDLHYINIHRRHQADSSLRQCQTPYAILSTNHCLMWHVR
jgi:hypothetical protein